MAGEHFDAISRVDDLITMDSLNPICYIVQARAQCSTKQQLSPLTFSVGIHVSLIWEVTYGEQELQGRDSVVRVCKSSTTTTPESVTLYDFTGKFLNRLISGVCQMHSLSDRYLDGNLMISTSQSDSVCVKHCMQRVAQMMQVTSFSNW